MIEAARKRRRTAARYGTRAEPRRLAVRNAQATETQNIRLVRSWTIAGGNCGPLGSVAGQGGRARLTSLNTAGNTTVADIPGVQIMARAGYDPHDLASVFKLLEAQEDRAARK
jgi:predicted Zn-dependent protease